MKNRLLKAATAILLIIAIMFVAVACGEDKGTQNTQNPPENSSQETPSTGEESSGNKPNDVGTETKPQAPSDTEEGGKANVESDGYFDYKLNADGASYSIRAVLGSSAKALSIPSVYNKKPVTAIADDGFKRQASLTTLAIPDSVTSIGNHAFSQCYALTSVTFAGNTLKEIGDNAFFMCEYLNDVVIPTSVTSIGDGAFSGCYDLLNLYVPESVTRIGAEAFADTAFIKNVKASGIYYFGKVAYSYINPQKDNDGVLAPVSIVIKEGTVSVSGEAFKSLGGGKITSVSIPSTVKYIGKDAFTSVDVGSFTAAGNTSYRVENGALIENATDTLIRGSASATIGNSVKAIADSAFKNVKGLKNITIPSSVVSIGTSVFEGCSSLETVVLPENLSTIPERTFKDCTSLNGIRIGKYVADISKSAFSGCIALKKVYIDSSAIILACNLKFNAGQLLENAEQVYISDTAFTLVRQYNKENKVWEWVEDPEQEGKQAPVYVAKDFIEGESKDGYTVWNIKPKSERI